MDLDIEAGALVAITCPSGSGKPTLLHVIGGLDILSSGTLRIGDTQLDELPPRKLVAYRRRVGFVFQRFHLLPALTAADNVAAPLLPNKAGRSCSGEHASYSLPVRPSLLGILASARCGLYPGVRPMSPTPGRPHAANSEYEQAGGTHESCHGRPQLAHAEKERDSGYGHPNPPARARLVECWRDLRLPQPQPGPGEYLLEAHNAVDGTRDHEQGANDEVKTHGRADQLPRASNELQMAEVTVDAVLYTAMWKLSPFLLTSVVHTIAPWC